MSPSSSGFVKAGRRPSPAAEPAAWESGLRTDPLRRGFERWTVNALFQGGLRVALRFSTRAQQVTLLPPNPTVSIDICLPEGAAIHRGFSEGRGKALKASREYCEVNVSGSYLRQRDGAWQVYYIDDQLELSMDIRPLLSAWRPGDGLFSPDGGGREYGWMMPVPRGAAEATLRLRGSTLGLKGDAIIDHSWSNSDLGRVTDHWYLCRGFLGDYTAISLDLKLRTPGTPRLTLLYLARGAEVLLDGSAPCSAVREETFLHPGTRDFYDGLIRFSSQGFVLTHNWVKDYRQSSGPRFLGRLLKRLNLSRSTLVSHSDVSLALPPALGGGTLSGSGIMEQVSYTAQPQVAPGELLGGEWPEE